MAQLVEWLDSLVDWKIFGLYLPAITDDTISKIKVDEKNVSERKIELYSKWLKICPTATWSNVITALERMKENSLAKDIKQKLQFKKTVITALERIKENSLAENIKQGMYNYLYEL